MLLLTHQKSLLGGRRSNKFYCPRHMASQQAGNSICIDKTVRSLLIFTFHLHLVPFWLLHYSRFEVRLFIIRQNMNFGFWNFFSPNYSWLCVLLYDISKIHLKSCWLTQECLKHVPFSIFCLIWPNSISKKNGEKI